MCGKVNFTNLSRYSSFCERTYRRQYQQAFAFVEFNQHLITETIAQTADMIAAIDCSFVSKSGKGTYGLDWFYNGTTSRNERGLEISVIAVIDVKAYQGYSLSVQQTPPMLRSLHQPKSGKSKSRPVISRQTIEQAQQVLQQLPAKSQSPQPSVLPPGSTRLDCYLKQLQATRPHLPPGVRYLVADGFYSKQTFVNGVLALNLQLISKLRVDAHLRYCYSGPQKSKGRHRKYDGKVELNDLSRFTLVEALTAHLTLYTAVVWHVSLKRRIRLALLVDTHNPAKPGYILLFSTDVELDAIRLLNYYKARYAIEFIFRDAKQFTGLCDAQTRKTTSLDFHFNASLSALNLAKSDAQRHPSHPDGSSSPFSFSMASYKRVAFNHHLLQRFIDSLGLDPSRIKSHPNYQNLLSYGSLVS